MAVIANLAILMTADVQKAERSIRGVGASFAGLKSGAAAAVLDLSAVSTTLSSIGRYGLVVGGVVAAIGGLKTAANLTTAAIEKMFTKFDEFGSLSDASQGIGESVANLQALSLQAKLSGSSQEELFSVMRKLNVTLFEAANGADEDRAAFDALGLSVSNLLNLSPAERFLAVSDAIKNTKDATTAAAAANDIFGKKWQGIINLVLSGSAGFREAQADVKKFGLAMTDFDAARMEAVGDQITRVKFALDGIIDKTLPALLNVTEKVFGKMLSLLERNQAAINGVAIGFGIIADRIFGPADIKTPDLPDVKLKQNLILEGEREKNEAIKEIGKSAKSFADSVAKFNVGAAFRGSAAALSPFLQRDSGQVAIQQQALAAQREANKALASIDKKLKPNSIVFTPVSF